MRGNMLAVRIVVRYHRILIMEEPMKTVYELLFTVCFLFIFSPRAEAADAPPPIRKVEINENRALQVNGKPFFPIMAWLQDAKNFPLVKSCGMNTTAGYWGGSSGTKNAAAYLKLVADAGLYGVMPFDKELKGHPKLLAYIHGDEPDLPHKVSDATVTAAPHLKINKSTPLWKLVDGVTHSWSVLDPLENAAVTIKLKKEVTVVKLGIHLTVSKNLPVAKKVSFAGDGKKIAEATLEKKKGRQVISLAKPASFRELTMTVLSVYPDKNEYGSVGEIEGFDPQGNNVLLAPPRNEPRTQPDIVLQQYKRIKTADPSRPVFMTVTGYFHPKFSKWPEEKRTGLYKRYIEATDVVGYDIYPIYGWNKPEWIYLVHDATRRLVGMAGDKPVYSWIETSRGGQWTGALERQHKVTPGHIRAEVWMAICRGATAIGYFTHIWKPSYNQFGVPEENRKALLAINTQLTRLAPAILGHPPVTPPTIKPENNVKLDIMAKQHDKSLYLFTVNYDERKRETKATILCPGLSRGTEVKVVDEARSIRSDAGSFADHFKPLDVHIYRIDR